MAEAIEFSKSKRGLKNLGNTCFINSILQCLVHVPVMQSYFLNGCHKLELNRRNMHGTRGKLALAFGQLSQELLSDNFDAPDTRDVKRIISQKQSQFRGFQQHDSQEFMSLLLQTLHEDLSESSHGA